jgi:hypothetical protein
MPTTIDKPSVQSLRSNPPVKQAPPPPPPPPSGPIPSSSNDFKPTVASTSLIFATDAEVEKAPKKGHNVLVRTLWTFIMLGGFLGQLRILCKATHGTNTHLVRLPTHGSRLHHYPCISLPDYCLSRGHSTVCAHGFKTRGVWRQGPMEQDVRLVLLRHGKLFLVWREYHLLFQGAFPLCSLLFVSLTALNRSMWSLRTRTSFRLPQTTGLLASRSTQLAS